MLPGQGQASCFFTAAKTARVAPSVWHGVWLVLGRSLVTLRGCVRMYWRRRPFGGRERGRGLCLFSWGGRHSPEGEHGHSQPRDRCRHPPWHS